MQVWTVMLIPRSEPQSGGRTLGRFDTEELAIEAAARYRVEHDLETWDVRIETAEWPDGDS